MHHRWIDSTTNRALVHRVFEQPPRVHQEKMTRRNKKAISSDKPISTKTALHDFRCTHTHTHAHSTSAPNHSHTPAGRIVPHSRCRGRIIPPCRHIRIEQNKKLGRHATVTKIKHQRSRRRRRWGTATSRRSRGLFISLIPLPAPARARACARACLSVMHHLQLCAVHVVELLDRPQPHDDDAGVAEHQAGKRSDDGTKR